MLSKIIKGIDLTFLDDEAKEKADGDEEYDPEQQDGTADQAEEPTDLF